VAVLAVHANRSSTSIALIVFAFAFSLFSSTLTPFRGTRGLKEKLLGFLQVFGKLI